jgi:transposase
MKGDKTNEVLGIDAHKRSHTVARLARGLVERCRLLSTEILNLDKELDDLVQQTAPTMLEVCGCATLNAANILGETADVRRFRSRHAYARHNGTAPLPVWSSNHPRHRLSRTGNRQLTPRSTTSRSRRRSTTDARAFLQGRRVPATTTRNPFAPSRGDCPDVVLRALIADAEQVTIGEQSVAA